ncbi:LXG domain-containing protein [Carnobacterium gallinarum]|uniref:LXG domain-containing protein n=1 Tax=Carnobacterium gallinarum TaxID=2749 RepID=UPI000552351D|nr:LXG domain-containing protein [Carnobacterium gallinarum]
MTKMDIGEYKYLLSQMKELKLTLGLSFTGTNGTIEEFSGDTKLKGVAWSSTKSYFSAGYTPMLDGLSDVFYTAITTLENFIRAFESEVTASGVKLDLDHLEDLQRRRDELQREKTNWLHQIAEQASKIPGLGHLFDDYSVLQAEKKVQLMEDFRDFIHRHDSDFSELNGLIEQVLLGLEELGKQRSFNGDKQGYSPINFMNLSWSKNLDSYHKKHGEEVKKVQKKDMENFKNMAEVVGGAVAMESFGMNSELSNMRTPLYEAGKEYFSGDGVKGPKSKKIDKANTSKKSNIKSRTQIELDDLARDPSHGGKITDDSKLERDIGLALEERGDLGHIVRDKTADGGAEFIDTVTGKKYDVKSFVSYPNGHTSPKKGAFTVDRSIKNIKKELNKNYNLIINTTDLTPEHRMELVNELKNQGIIDRIIFYP